MALSAREVAHFKREGWLLLRGALAPALMDRAVRDVWSAAPSWLDRADAATWRGSVEERADFASAEGTNHSGIRWTVQRSIEEGWMLDLVARNARVVAAVRQLQGARELEPPGTRGVYCTRPCFSVAGDQLAPEDCPPIFDSDNKGPDDSEDGPC